MAEESYLESLDPIAKVRYIKKLVTLGLKEKDDPYAASNINKFVDDMSLWPPLEYGHIFCYFIEHPGVYTQQELMRWKSLEAFNYFQSGFVRDVKLWPVHSAKCILRAYVNPSQRSPDKPHDAWVAIKMDGSIITAHCKCMAGLGEGCSHAAALMFKVESAVRNGYTASTSNLCRWNQIFSKKHEPARIVDINFVHPKHAAEAVQRPKKKRMIEPTYKEKIIETKHAAESSEAVQRPKKKRMIEPTYKEKKAFIDTIQTLLPTSAILNVTTIKISARSNHAVARVLPPTIMSFHHAHYRMKPKAELISESESILKTILFDKDSADYLAEVTKLQSDSLVWFEHRKGRITASRFGAVCRTSIESPSKSLIEAILQKKPMPKVPAIEWGVSNEDTARKEYISKMHSKHTNFTAKCTGLHLHPLYPYLGASPDGLVFCSCCGRGLLEIKCPYSKRNFDPTKVCDKSFYLKPTKTGVKLSQDHNYYYQVQGQLSLCECNYCDFVCWTPVAMHIERIKLDTSFFNRMEPKLKQFFVQCIFPEVLCGGDFEPDPVEVYCSCQREEFGLMVACDNPACRYKWFHFQCVNIVDEPDGNWFCPDCIE